MLSRNEQVVTLLFMIALSAVVIAFDVVMYRRGMGSTISVVCRSLFEHLPTLGVLFVFWVGVLVGHLFPPQ